MATMAVFVPQGPCLGRGPMSMPVAAPSSSTLSLTPPTSRTPELVTETEKTFFEGAEKLLEIWFCSSFGPGFGGSLRAIPKWELDELLDIARCKIVSSVHNDKLDAYVLSESSLFVSERRLILKTCGTTRLLDALERILELAAKYCQLDQVANLFYSRRNFVRPDQQPDRHRSFDAEIAHLDRHFEDGAAYCLGRLNQDRWYLYTLNPPPLMRAKHADHTLEILMSDLDVRVMRIFHQDVCSSGKEATKLSGIDQLVPVGTVIDDKLFEPCGYSMNGIVPNTDQYVTIHITPEPEFSYVSYETNLNQLSLFEQTTRVLKCFRPERFLMTLFANKVSLPGLDAQQSLWEKELVGYERKDLQFLTLPDDTLVYAQYRRVK